MAKAAPIPIIDIAGAEQDQTRIAEELVDAAIKYGFVYIRTAVSQLQRSEQFLPQSKFE